MPLWAWIVLAVGIVLVIGATAAAGYFGWRALVRRLLLRLLSKTEATEAAAQGLVDVVHRLAESSDEELESFADDADSPERRALHEVHGRALIIREEVDRLALPNALVELADAIGDAAHLIAEESGRVPDELTGPAALEALGDMDLTRVAEYVTKVRALLRVSCDECGVEDTSVYGGGLYL